MLVLGLGLTLIVELLVYIRIFWPARLVFASLLIMIIPGLTVAIIIEQPGLWSALTAYISLLRLFSLLRLAGHHLDPKFLKLRAQRTSTWSTVAQLPLLLALFYGLRSPSAAALLMALAFAQVLFAAFVLYTVWRNVRHATPPKPTAYLPDRDLPTVSVLIPARNETQDLADCLSSVLGSDYPKLEVIVLDDCSHDRTPEIIKSFAHDGVRFVGGEEPDTHWLAKNAAYDRLAREASGELLLFCGVDVRFETKTIRQLVNAMAHAQKSMVCLMPQRQTAGVPDWLMQPMRYWWELALPRRALNRPPVLSTCWAIQKSSLENLGGFASASRSIIPEGFFAKQLIKTDGYAFWRSHDDLLLRTAKTAIEQRATVVRVRYPELHQRAELAFALIGLELVLLLAPLVQLFIFAFSGQMFLALLSILTTVLLLAAHGHIQRATMVQRSPLTVIAFPAAVVSEMYHGILSMCRYEFSIVEWKGRNISAPIMRVIPKLPPLE